MLNRKPDVAVGKSSCSQTTNGGSSGREVPDGRWRETKIMAKIGFIGMGNIGYAIMRSLLNKYKTEDITFTDLNRGWLHRVMGVSPPAGSLSAALLA